MSIALPEIQNPPHHNKKLPVDVRPEWTLVSVGRDLTTTACIIAGRILVTRTCGFSTTQDAEKYCTLIEKCKAEGLDMSQPYVHVTEWSNFKGGSIGARKHAWEFHRSQSRLQLLLFCGASPLMRMSVLLTQQVSPLSCDILFCSDLDQGIHTAGKRLGLPLPKYFELPSAFTSQTKHDTTLSDQVTLLYDPPPADGLASYEAPFSNGHRIIFRRIGKNKLFCHIKGQKHLNAIPKTEILKARRTAVSKCLPGQSGHIEIWDCTNFESLFHRNAARRFIKALISDSLPLVGCFFLDIGCKMRFLVRWLSWLHRPTYPVHCLASLTMAILQAHESLQAADRLSPIPPPKIYSKPQWRFVDGNFFIKNEIIDQDIIHCHSRGYLRMRHIAPILSIQRKMALETIGSGRSYYIIGGTDVMKGGSYKARQRFLWATRKLYRDFPFRMYVFYGAKGKIKAAINLAKHRVPYRMVLADDYDSAIAVIRADKVRRMYLDQQGEDIDFRPLSPVASQVLQQNVDDILSYLSNISWERGNKIHPKPPLSANHPFVQIYDAIDLINDDLKTIYQERQQAADERQKLQAQLSQSRKMEALGLLAGGVAHELNNILGGIVSYPDVMLMDLPEGSSLRGDLKTIQRSGKKAASIVSDLLIMARRAVNTMEVLNINTLVRNYLESPEFLNISQQYPEVTVKTDLALNLKNIKGSPLHIRQAMMNLVINAIEASDRSGSVAIYTKNQHLDHPLQGFDTIPAGNYITIEVQDHGVGIDKKDQEHIFEPFYTKKKMGRSGTGLGMAVVWGTMQDSNGYIDLCSEIGQGTKISLLFPMTDEELPVRSEKNIKKIAMGHKESILVVDDVLQQREVALAILSRLNYRASAVDSGTAALAFLEKQSVDLVVVDMIMDTGIDGLETIQKIKRCHPNQKTIICTGYSEDIRIEEAQTLCDGPMVNKPYSIETLAAAVNRTLLAANAK